MSRPSAIYRSSNVNNTPSSLRSSLATTTTAHNSRSTSTTDRFPILDFKEISQCLEMFNITCSEELLLKPSQSYMLTLFQQIADTFLNISDKKFYKVINDIDNDNEYIDTLNLVGLQKIIYKFLNDCGIDDFNILDIIKPESQRVRRILSCVINFARFREEHKHIADKLQLKNQEILSSYKNLQTQQITLQNEITNLNKINEQADLPRVTELNIQLENELRDLKKKQESLTYEYDSYKREKSNLLKNYEDVSFLLVESQKELDNLKQITNESPELVAQYNKDLNNNWLKEQEKLTNLETRSRNLSISIESFNWLELEFKNYLKLLEDLQIGINKGESTNTRLTNYKELLETKQYELQDIERKLKLTSRQIENNENKLTRSHQTTEEKKINLLQILQDLHNQHATLVTERNLTDQDLLGKKKQIQIFENKINELKFQYNEEIKETNYEIMKLNSHIKTYIAEIANRL